MDLNLLLAWIVGANTVINFATTVYTLLSARATRALKAAEDLSTRLSATADAVSERFQKAESRLLRVEADIQHLPSREQAHDLQIAIERLAGRMETLDERLTGRMDTLDERIKPIAATSARIQNFLMEQAAER